MALTTTQINELYLAYFGRPADFNGFGFWQTAPTPIIASNGFSSSPEFSSTYGQASAITLCTALYNNLFNRTPDAPGLIFWTNALNNGLSLPDLITEMIAAARGAAGTDAATLTNRLNAAQTFTTSLDTSTKISAYEQKLTDPAIKALMDAASTGISTSALEALVQQTINTLLGNTSAPDTTPPTPTPTPQTFTLTSNPDNFTGTAADDIFKGVVNGGATTYQNADVLNGDGGTDQLQLEVSNSFVLNSANISNIERLVLKVTNADSTVAIANLKDFTRIENVDSSASLTIGDSIDRLNSIPRLDITRSTGDTTLKFNASALSGAADKIDVYVTDTGSLDSLRNVVLTAPGAAANQFETVHLNVTGTNGIELRTDDAQTTLSTLEIDGSGSLVLALGQSNDNINSTLTTINASAASGNLVIGSSATPLGASTTAINLGTGNNTIFMGANLTSATTLAGGTGTGIDTLVVTKALTGSDLTNVSGIEVFRFDSTDTIVLQDAGLAKLSGASYEVLGVNVLELSSLADSANVKLVGAINTLSLGLNSSAGANDALNLTLAGAGSLGSLSWIAGLETLNIRSDGATNTIADDLVTAKHVITGNGDLTIGGTLQTTQVDASGFTGKLTLKAGTTATTITGGSGNDDITGGSGADIITVGAGDNIVRLGAKGGNAASGADRITLGTGNDTVLFVSNNSNGDGAATNYNAFAQISGFQVGTVGTTDKLQFSAADLDFTVNSSSGLAKGTTVKDLTGGDLVGLQTLSTGAGVVSGASTTSFFKLTTTNTAFTTDIKGTFAAALGNTAVIGLANNGLYLISVYDNTNQKMVVGVVNAGGDGTLAAADLTNSGIAVVGVLDMTATAYQSFGINQIAVAA